MQDAQTIINAAFQHLDADLGLTTNVAAARWLSEQTGFAVNDVDVSRWRRNILAKSAKVLIPLIVTYCAAQSQTSPATDPPSEAAV